MNDPEIRFQAAEIIRTIVDRIEVGPDPSPTEQSAQSAMKIVLYGQLAAVMALAEDKIPLENKGRLSCVAGARNSRQFELPPVEV